MNSFFRWPALSTQQSTPPSTSLHISCCLVPTSVFHMNFCTAHHVLSTTWMTTSNVVSTIFTSLISSFTIASLHRKVRCCANNIVKRQILSLKSAIVFARVHDRKSKLDPLFFGLHSLIVHITLERENNKSSRYNFVSNQVCTTNHLLNQEELSSACLLHVTIDCSLSLT